MAYQTTYERLRGERVSAGAVMSVRPSLWMADDHLLSVVNDGYTETYKRFYFRDIQAIVMRRTWGHIARRILHSLFAGVFAILCASGLIAGWPLGAQVTSASLCILGLLLLLADVRRGPTCATFIKTAVQTERLLSLGRVSHVKALMGRLQDRIRDAQGELDGEEAGLQYDEARREAADPAAAEKTAPAPAIAPVSAVVERSTRALAAQVPRKRYDSHAHMILFTILIGDVCHTLLRFYYAGIALLLFGLLMTIALVSAIVFALIKQHRTDLAFGVQALTWVTLGYMVAGFIIGSVYSVVDMILKGTPSGGSTWEAMVAEAGRPAHESIPFMILLAFSLIGSASLGFSGLLSLNRFMRTRGRPPPLTLPPEAPPPPPPQADADTLDSNPRSATGSQANPLDNGR